MGAPPGLRVRLGPGTEPGGGGRDRGEAVRTDRRVVDRYDPLPAPRSARRPVACRMTSERGPDRVHMTREVFVFGTSHSLQCGAAQCGADRIALLEQELRRVLSEYGIRRCQSAFNIDPQSASKIDPLSGTVEVVQVVNGGIRAASCSALRYADRSRVGLTYTSSLLTHRGKRAAGTGCRVRSGS